MPLAENVFRLPDSHVGSSGFSLALCLPTWSPRKDLAFSPVDETPSGRILVLEVTYIP